MKPLDTPLAPPGVRTAMVTGHVAARTRTHNDLLAEEVPVALVFNGISHAVMLATPADLEDFALGFGLSEAILAHAGELRGVDLVSVAQGIEVRMEVAPPCEWRLRQRRRSLAGRTGCGLCGTESLDQVRRTLPNAPVRYLAAQAICRAQREMRLSQALQQLTGATHAAAWCHPDGAVAMVREDIGRHNALDKLIGGMVRARISAADGFICVTSRASFEMVQKAAMAGVGILAAVSAPTALAVQTAQMCGLALAGFVRGDNLVAYTFPERLGLVAHLDKALHLKELQLGH